MYDEAAKAISPAVSMRSLAKSDMGVEDFGVGRTSAVSQSGSGRGEEGKGDGGV